MAFESLGIYFAIIVGVAKQIAYFLFILLLIIISFAHALVILLRPSLNYSLDKPTINNDPNNPWNLNTIYYKIENGTIAQDALFAQGPDNNTRIQNCTSCSLSISYRYDYFFYSLDSKYLTIININKIFYR